MSERWIVITTINPPTRTVELVSALCAKDGWSAVVVGDTKTAPGWHCDGITFLSVDDQRELFGAFADQIPYRHYCRKNLGYLYAIERGAQLILETDDDNNPYPAFGRNINLSVSGRMLTGAPWINVYPHFLAGDDNARIWPRGLPLDAIDDIGTLDEHTASADCAVQQFLADNDPDVDAIYRLTTKTPVFFDRDAPAVITGDDVWVPFNSQNTVFFREAFPLLYLPGHVSFRMTDIWRSFVAQAALRHHGGALAFHGPTVEQLRNGHDLMRDFADEVVGYLHNREIREVLTGALSTLPDGGELSATVTALWRALIDADIVPAEELPLVDAWHARITALTQG